MSRDVEEMGIEPFLVFREPEGFGKGGQRHLEKAERVLEDNVTVVDGQGHDLGAVDDLFREDVLYVEFVQDQVVIEPLGIVRQHRQLVIEGQLSQPIQEIANARDSFEAEELVAVGDGGTHEVGYVDPRVLHGLAVPIHEQRVLGARALRPIRLAFSRFQQFSLFFQLGGVLDETLVAHATRRPAAALHEPSHIISVPHPQTSHASIQVGRQQEIETPFHLVQMLSQQGIVLLIVEVKLCSES